MKEGQLKPGPLIWLETLDDSSMYMPRVSLAAAEQPERGSKLVPFHYDQGLTQVAAAFGFSRPSFYQACQRVTCFLA